MNIFKTLISKYGGWRVKVAIGLLLLSTAGGITATIKYQSNTIDKLKSEKTVLVNDNDNLRQDNSSLKNEIKDIQDLHRFIYEQQSLSDERVENLKRIFQENKKREPRDIGKLAQSKPLLINKATNRGTKDVFRCFEAITEGKHEENCYTDSK